MRGFFIRKENTYGVQGQLVFYWWTFYICTLKLTWSVTSAYGSVAQLDRATAF